MTDGELNQLRALYAAEISMVGRRVGYLLETISLLGLRENTLVNLMSDHGHYFADHGLQGKPWGDLGQLYEPMTHIPFIVASPDRRHHTTGSPVSDPV